MIKKFFIRNQDKKVEEAKMAVSRDVFNATSQKKAIKKAIELSVQDQNRLMEQYRLLIKAK